MSAIFPERYTTEMDGSFVVFLIGSRINRWSALSKWLTVGRAFNEMVGVLQSHPEKGFLKGEQFFRLFPMETLMVSYWRSFDDLERFARDRNDPHLKAWQDFYRNVGFDGSVGIWHETYLIEPNHYETLYGNMPLFGLAAASQKRIKAGGRRNTARERVSSPVDEAEPVQA